MHIALIISSFNLGGAEISLINLANYLVSLVGKDYKVSIITFAPPLSLPCCPLSPKVNLLQINQLQNYRSSYLIRFKNIIKRIVALRRAISLLDPDVIISFVDLTNIASIVATIGLKIPVIVSERTHPFYYNIPKIYQQLRIWLYPRAFRVVMQTDPGANYFKSVCGAANVIVIPNAVRKPSNRKEFLSSTVNQVVSVGRLCSSKGFDTLIYAFAKIINYFPNLTLTIYGEGDERSNLENLITDLNLQRKVFLPGVSQQIPEMLFYADLFVFPSHYEGFPNALAEAMAAGLPIIASNCCGNADLVVDRVNGCLFPVGNVDVLVTVMQELIDNFDLRSKLSLAARKIVDQFSEDRIYAKWQEIIDITGAKPEH
jgi:glycosyltransferase involved in cell wall biosynthesis